APDGLDLLFPAARVLAKHEVRTGLSQAKGDGPADALGGAGHDCDLVGESEAGEVAHQISPRMVPPISSAAPVMKRASGDARKTAACATSTGSPIPIGICLSYRKRATASSRSLVPYCSTS